jgi:hypothetical protein
VKSTLQSCTVTPVYDAFNNVYKIWRLSTGTPTSADATIEGVFRITNSSSSYPAYITSFSFETISNTTYGSITYDWTKGVIPKSSYQDVGFKLELLAGAPNGNIVSLGEDGYGVIVRVHPSTIVWVKHTQSPDGTWNIGSIRLYSTP